MGPVFTFSIGTWWQNHKWLIFKSLVMPSIDHRKFILFTVSDSAIKVRSLFNTITWLLLICSMPTPLLRSTFVWSEPLILSDRIWCLFPTKTMANRRQTHESSSIFAQTTNIMHGGGAGIPLVLIIPCALTCLLFIHSPLKISKKNER